MNSNLVKTLATALMALVFGFLGAALWSYTGLADNRTRDFLLSNPKILPDMFEALQAEEMNEQLAALDEGVYTPFPGAVMGNPNGSKVLVEFSDYYCSHCRISFSDVTRLISEDPELKVVVREWPIFEGSDEPARMALAAAKQGKYRAFHEAMFESQGAGPEAVEAAAMQAGLDLEKARTDAQSEAVTAELLRNGQFAEEIGFSGTPGWLTKSRIIPGRIGYDGMKEALYEEGASEDS